MRSLLNRILLVLALLVIGLPPASPAVGAQDDPALFEWELVESTVETRDLFVAADSAIFLTGSDGVFVWRKSPDRFVEVSDDLRLDRITMTSHGHLFFGASVAGNLLYSKDYLHTFALAVDDGAALIETPTRALVAAPDGLGIERSTDGGDTWVQHGRGSALFNSHFGRSFALSDPTPERPFGRLVSVGRGGAVYSDDDGVTWHPSTLGNVFFYDSRSVTYSRKRGAFYAIINGSVEDGGSTLGVVRESVDGLRWTVRGRIPTDGNEVPGQITAGPDGSLWAIQKGGVEKPVYRSMDGGVTWEVAGVFDGEALVGNPLRLQDIEVGPEGRVWVGFTQGEGGSGLVGAVLRTVEPVAVVSEAPTMPEREILLREVWPNPAGSTVQITIAASERVRVRVVDVLGREAVLVHVGPVGTPQTFVVDTAGWAAGSYIVEVEAEERRETHTFTVVR